MSLRQEVSTEIRQSLVNRVSLIPIDSIRESIRRTSGNARGVSAKLLVEVGHEAIAELVSQGVMFTQIARTLGVPAPTLMKFVDDCDNPEDLYEPARRAAADMYVALANEVIIDMELDKDHISRAKAQAAHFTKMAGFFDAMQFGTNKSTSTQQIGTQVQYNIIVGEDQPVSLPESGMPVIDVTPIE